MGAFTRITLVTGLAIGAVSLSCVQEQSGSGQSGTNRAQTSGAGDPKGGGNTAGDPISANGSGSPAAPVVAVIPNYGGAPSILSTLVDSAAAQMPARAAASQDGSGPSFGSSGGVAGGGLLAGMGNLLRNLFGLGDQP